jgi:hypothetical protein
VICIEELEPPLAPYLETLRRAVDGVLEGSDQGPMLESLSLDDDREVGAYVMTPGPFALSRCCFA